MQGLSGVVDHPWAWMCDAGCVCGDGGVAKCWLKFPGGMVIWQAREECTPLVVGAGGGRGCTPPPTHWHIAPVSISQLATADFTQTAAGGVLRHQRWQGPSGRDWSGVALVNVGYGGVDMREFFGDTIPEKVVVVSGFRYANSRVEKGVAEELPGLQTQREEQRQEQEEDPGAMFKVYIYIYIPYISHIYPIYIPYISHIYPIYIYIPYIYIYIYPIYISHIYPIYIPYISHIYPIYIPYIYPIYISHIFPIYFPYIIYIYPIYIPYISHIYPIYIPYISHIYPIYIPYISHIYPIYIPYIYIYIPYISHIYRIYIYISPI